MDNRSYDPDQIPTDPLQPDPNAPRAEDADHLGRHHEQPIPVDPLGGMPHQQGLGQPLQSGFEAHRSTYEPEHMQRAIDHQQPHSPSQPTGGDFTQAPYGLPPQEQPNAPGQPYQPGGPGYPPPAPPSDRKGFNWLMCCGITCGVLLLLGIIMGVFFWNMISGFIGLGKSMEATTETVTAASIADIQAEAQAVSAADLSSNPESFKGQWIVMEGELRDEADGAAGAFESTPGLENATSYWVAPNIMVLDVSATPAVGDDGDTIRVYGQAEQMDMASIPVIGKTIAEEMAKDPTFGGSSKVVFLIAKQVELVSAGEPADNAEGPDAAADEGTAAEGDAPPAADAGTDGGNGWEGAAPGGP